MIEGQPAPSSPEAGPKAVKTLITSGYFAALGVPLFQGRAFTERDTGSSEPVVILNEAAARHWFGSASPIGKRIRFRDEKAWRTVVRVAANTASTFYNTLEWLTKPGMYIPQDQSPTAGLPPVRSAVWLYIHAASPLSRKAVKTALQAADPSMPVEEVQSMAQFVADTERQPKLRTAVLTCAAGLTVFLAALGIYGVVSQSVTQRTREIGIRMTVGAESGDVFRLILRQALGLTAAGVAAGIVSAFLLAKTVSSFLYGVAPTSPWVFVIAVSVLLIATIAAVFVPARAAIRVDPMIAKRRAARCTADETIEVCAPAKTKAPRSA